MLKQQLAVAAQLEDYKEVERFAEVVRGGLVLCFRRLIKKAIAEERFEAFGGKSAAVPMGALGSAYFDPREKFSTRPCGVHLNLGNEQGKE